MRRFRRLLFTTSIVLFAVLAMPSKADAQVKATTAPVTNPPIHTIEGQLHYEKGRVRGVHVRLIQEAGLRLIGRVVSRSEGDFVFQGLVEGPYLVETDETDLFQASSTFVSVRALTPGRPYTARAIIFLTPKIGGGPPGPAPVDSVDGKVPKAALKHYESGEKALEQGNSEQAVAEFRKAVELHPLYYSARLALGRELRFLKQYEEAEATLKPLVQIAPTRFEPRTERGIVLLQLGRIDEAVIELREAVRIDETNWAGHLYLGWALLDQKQPDATGHLEKALAIDETKAARAHIALARIANDRGDRARALEHLDAYLNLSPFAPDAEAVRALANRLRGLAPVEAGEKGPISPT